jgi:DNA-binding transcriptional MerR regulator
MLKIGDFSKLGQVSVRTLRHYETLDLFQPAYIDRFTDYRYYSVDQLPRLNRIVALKDLGFSLGQIKQLLDSNLPACELRGMFKLKQAEIEQQIEVERSRLERVEARLRQIEQEGQFSEYEVVIKSVEPQTIASRYGIIPTLEDMPQHRHALYESLYQQLSHTQIKIVAPEMALYHNTEYTEHDIHMEAAVTISSDAQVENELCLGEKLRIYELPAVENMASIIYHGRHPDVPQVAIGLFTWMEANQHVPAGCFRELHPFWSELNQDVDSDSVVFELQIPIQRQLDELSNVS